VCLCERLEMAQVDVMWAWRRRWSMVTDRNANQEYYRSRVGVKTVAISLLLANV
jgi:hypothetical protein